MQAGAALPEAVAAALNEARHHFGLSLKVKTKKTQPHRHWRVSPQLSPRLSSSRLRTKAQHGPRWTLPKASSQSEFDSDRFSAPLPSVFAKEKPCVRLACLLGRCTICIGEFNTDDGTLELACSHVFHDVRECL